MSQTSIENEGDVAEASPVNGESSSFTDCKLSRNCCNENRLQSISKSGPQNSVVMLSEILGNYLAENVMYLSTLYAINFVECQ